MSILSNVTLAIQPIAEETTKIVVPDFQSWTLSILMIGAVLFGIVKVMIPIFYRFDGNEPPDWVDDINDAPLGYLFKFIMGITILAHLVYFAFVNHDLFVGFFAPLLAIMAIFAALGIIGIILGIFWYWIIGAIRDWFF